MVLRIRGFVWHGTLRVNRQYKLGVGVNRHNELNLPILKDIDTLTMLSNSAVII